MVSLRRRGSYVAWLLLLWGACRAETPPTHIDLEPTTPFPAPLAIVREFAAAHGVPLTGFSPARAGGCQTGDRAVALVSLRDEASLTQWLVDLQIDALTAAEATEKRSEGKLYVSTGRVFPLRVDPVAITLHTYGPIRAAMRPDEIRTRTARVLVNADNLALGLDRACAACVRIIAYKKTIGETGNIGFSFGNAPFAPDEIALAQSIAAHLNITADEERALGSAGPALASFFQIAQTAPGLREIVFEVTDLPSAWSVVKRGGRIVPSIFLVSRQISAFHDRESGQSGFYLPIRLDLNGQPALDCVLAVRSPVPPYLTTAGVLGIYAAKPSHTDRRLATIQLLSAILAPSRTARAD